jgi:23S rRNA (guanosine2251-2'-O)-methyltransferase
MRTPPSKSRPFRRGRSGPESERPRQPGPPRGPRQEQARDAVSRPSPSRPSPSGASVPAPSVARNLLLYGAHPVAAAWLNPERRCLHLYGVRGALDEFAPTLERAAAAGLKRPAPIEIDRDALDRMLPPGAVHQGLALDAEPLPEIGLEDVVIAAGPDPVLLVLLDQVTDPHNVGAIVRSAAAFGAKGVIVQRRHAPEISGVLAKAASGAIETVPMLRETNLSRSLAELRDSGFSAVGLDERGDRTIAEAELGPKVVLALGAEGSGLRRLVAEGCGLLARLPTEPPITSLNVSNAAAVALYEIARRRAG